MTDETTEDIRKILRFYKEGKEKVHIKIIAGDDAKLFRNGFILDVKKNKFLMVDDVVGSCQYKFSEINPKVMLYKKEKKNEN